MILPSPLIADPLSVLDAKVDQRGVLRLFIGNEVIDPDLLRLLKEEARLLSGFNLWRIMQETSKHKASEVALKSSTKWEDVLPGKMMLHVIGIQKSIVDTLEKAKVEEK